jgi:hypothetical protein
VSTSDDQSDEVNEKPAKGGADIKFTKDNGKHLEIELDPAEWLVIGLFVLAMTTILAVTGVI